MEDPFVAIDRVYDQEMQQAITDHGADPAAFVTARNTVEAKRAASKASVNRQAFEGNIVAREANAASLRGKANTALTTNATYLAQPAIPPSPTNAQLIAAVRIIRDQTDALTKQGNAIIKLMLGLLDDVSGT